MKKLIIKISIVVAFIFVLYCNAYCQYYENVVNYSTEYNPGSVGGEYRRTNDSYNSYSMTCDYYAEPYDFIVTKYREDDNNYYLNYEIYYKNTSLTGTSFGSGAMYLSSAENTKGISYSSSYSIYKWNTWGYNSYRGVTNTYRNDYKETRNSSLNINGCSGSCNSIYEYDKTSILNNNTTYSGTNPNTTYSTWSPSISCSGIKANSTGATITSKGSTDNTLGYYNYKYEGLITINKNYKDKYIYLQMITPTCIRISNKCSSYNRPYGESTSSHYYSVTDNGYTNYYYAIASNKAIDISGYLYCEHEWKETVIDSKTEHQIKCPKCEWTKYANHSMDFEYDGIENNLCICGYSNKIRYYYDNEDVTYATKSEILDSYSKHVIYRNPNKARYNFDYYEIYKKQPISLSTSSITNITELEKVFVATSSSISERTEYYSTIFKPVYIPWKYTIKCNYWNGVATNSIILKDITVDDTINLPTIKVLPNSANVIGWVDKDGNKLDSSLDVDKLLLNENGEVEIYFKFGEDDTDSNNDIDSNDGSSLNNTKTRPSAFTEDEYDNVYFYVCYDDDKNKIYKYTIKDIEKYNKKRASVSEAKNILNASISEAENVLKMYDKTEENTDVISTITSYIVSAKDKLCNYFVIEENVLDDYEIRNVDTYKKPISWSTFWDKMWHVKTIDKDILVATDSVLSDKRFNTIN